MDKAIPLRLDKYANLSQDEKNQLLFAAIRRRKLEKVDRLLNAGADPLARDELDHTPAEGAAIHGRLAVLNRLLQIETVRSNIHGNENQVLRFACLNGHLDVVNRLLEFDSVVEHITIRNNLALQWAEEHNHPEIVARLREFPAVVQFQERRQALAMIQRQERRQAPADQLQQDVQSSESAMDSHITDNERRIQTAIEELYRADWSKEKQQSLLTDLKLFLEREYHNSPAKDQHGYAIPLEYSNAIQGKDLENLLTHPIHAAWRYLFARPNPWICLTASYIDSTENGAQATIFGLHWKLIAQIWQLFKDNHATLKKGFDRASCQKSFIYDFYHLSRAHNFDQSRIVKKIFEGVEQSQKEEYDDREKDKPTCSSGIIRRLLHSVHAFELADCPETRFLSPKTLYDRFRESLITAEDNTIFYIVYGMDEGKLRILKSALEKVIQNPSLAECNAVEKNLLSALKPSPTEVARLLEDTKTYYTSKRISEFSKISFQGDQFSSVEIFYQALADKAYYYFIENIQQIVDKAIQRLESEQTNPQNPLNRISVTLDEYTLSCVLERSENNIPISEGQPDFALIRRQFGPLTIDKLILRLANQLHTGGGDQLYYDLNKYKESRLHSFNRVFNVLFNPYFEEGDIQEYRIDKLPEENARLFLNTLSQIKSEIRTTLGQNITPETELIVFNRILAEFTHNIAPYLHFPWNLKEEISAGLSDLVNDGLSTSMRQLTLYRDASRPKQEQRPIREWTPTATLAAGIAALIGLVALRPR